MTEVQDGDTPVGVGVSVEMPDLPEMEVGGDEQPAVKSTAPVAIEEGLEEPADVSMHDAQMVGPGDEPHEEEGEDEPQREMGIRHFVLTEIEPFERCGQDEWDNTPITSFTSAMEDLIDVNADGAAALRGDPSVKVPMLVYAPKSIGSDSIRRPNSEWRVSKVVGRQRIGIGTPRITTPTTVLRGNMAQAVLRRICGLGANIVIALPRSCIYLEIAPPGDDEIIQNDYSYITDRTRIGISTNGMLLAATSGLFVENTVMLALRHVINTNVANIGNDLVTALLERIDPLDYPLIVNAMMAARYANGYPWILRCINQECGHQHEGRLNFARCQRIDFSMLTDAQLTMLATKNRSITDKELKEYRDMFKLSDKTNFYYNENTRIVLTTGSLMGFIDSARAWKTTIEASQTNALTSYASDNERNQYLKSQVQAHFMRKFGHFVEQIVLTVGNEEKIIEDYDDIVRCLTDLSRNVERAAEFENHVLAWLEDLTISIIGYPAWTCESCNTDQARDKEGPFRNFVPIAIDRVFFLASRLLSEKLAVLTQIQSEA